MKRYKRHLPKDHKKQKMEYEKTKKKKRKRKKRKSTIQGGTWYIETTSTPNITKESATTFTSLVV